MPRQKKSTLEVEVVNMAVPQTPTEVQRGLFSLNDKNCRPFGSDNLFPQALALLFRKSPVHRSIITNKAYYITGSGFSYDDLPKLNDIVTKANAYESLEAIMHKLAIDRMCFGNSYMEVVRVGGVISLYHQDATACRISKEGNSVIVNSNWSRYDKKNSIEIPLYPNFARINGQLRSIIHIKDYEPEFKTYGIPQSVAAMDAAAIAYKTNKWNVSRLDNSFQSSGVLLVDGNLSADDAAKLKKKFKEEFTGEGNQGKVLFIAQNLGGQATTSWTPMTSGNEGDWINLHKQSTDELITAHNWFPSLSGISTAGALGNTQQIRNEYQIALNTVISYEQNVFMTAFKRVISEQIDVDASSLSIVNKSPISLLDRVNLNNSMRKWEIRKIAGLDYDPDDVNQQSWNTVNITPQTNV